MTSELDDIGDIDSQVLEIEYENAKERLQQQQEALKEFSREGMQMFQILLLFVTAPTAVLGVLDLDTLIQINSLIISNGCAVSGLSGCAFQMSTISALAGVGLVVSAGVNILAAGYESRGVHNTSNPADIHQTLSTNKSLEGFWKERLSEYKDRIEHNDRIISVEESLLATGKFTLVVSILTITTIAVVFLTDSPVSFYWWVVILLLFLFSIVYPFVQTPREYREADRYFRYVPVYNSGYTQADSNDQKVNDEVGDSQSEESNDSEIENEKSEQVLVDQ